MKFRIFNDPFNTKILKENNVFLVLSHPPILILPTMQDIIAGSQYPEKCAVLHTARGAMGQGGNTENNKHSLPHRCKIKV